MDEEPSESAVLRFAIQVRDRVHLAQVMRNLRRLSEVARITRS
jgi:(p)ppGpp synthase/HD superfamily hydrolase